MEFLRSLFLNTLSQVWQTFFVNWPYLAAGKPRWFHKTVYGSANSRIPILRIHTSLARKLSQQASVPVQGELPLVTETLACRNVLGLLPGCRSHHTVVLAAHYDHAMSVMTRAESVFQVPWTTPPV